jgi:hypothetical protein
LNNLFFIMWRTTGLSTFLGSYVTKMLYRQNLKYNKNALEMYF